MAQDGGSTRDTQAGERPAEAGRAVPPPLPATDGANALAAEAHPKTADTAKDAPQKSASPAEREAARKPPEPAAAPAPPEDGDGGRRLARRRPAGPARGALAANDDVSSIGGLIFALHQKPSRRPLEIAAVASAVWCLVGVLLGWAMLAPELQRAPTFLEMLTRPTAIVLAATIIIPVALFWLLAVLAWRAQELKLMSSAMTEVAIRLAEPDRMAEQQIASVGQAVRRQVAFMNEAVSRALGRATELEAMVQNEVASLERSYIENENRIQGLLQEISGERHALLNTSERVNASLRELGSEIPVLVEKLSEQQVKLARFIEHAGQNIVALEQTLNQSSSHLAQSVGARTQELQSALSEGADRLQHLLVDKASEFQQSFEAGAERLTSAMGERTETMRAVFDTFSDGLNEALTARTEGLQAVLEEYTRALDATMQSRQQSLDNQLIERTKALDDAFSERLKLFDDSILRSTIAIDSMVADKARALSAALESHAKEISQVLGRQALELDEQLMHGVNAVRVASQNVTKQSLRAIEGLAGQADLLRNVSENLVNQISGVTNRFDQQGQTIMRAANALETANYRIDKMLQNRQTELSQTLESLAARTDAVERTLKGYSSTLEGTFNDAEARARAVGEQLTRSAEERSRQTISELERIQSQSTVDADRSLQELRNRVASLSREVSNEIGSLSSRFNDTSEDMRKRAYSTLAEIENEQARIKAQLERLPEATRATAETMRASLQEQLRALEQLSSLTHREAVRGDLSAPLPPVQPAASAARSISSVTQSLANEMAQRATAALPAPLPSGRMAPAHHSGPAPAAPAAESQRDGWKLGDLLARASQAEETRGPLNITAMARALDATTASAIWSRFRSGQRGVMVRSIYTAEGRTTFDEIQRRYRSEPDFRQTVDGYMHDFEQLLRDADHRDPSGHTAQTYIVSDPGRVYLFLAHASGRLA